MFKGGFFSRWEIFIMFGWGPVDRDKCNTGKMGHHWSTDLEKVKGDVFQRTKWRVGFFDGNGMFPSTRGGKAESICRLADLVVKWSAHLLLFSQWRISQDHKLEVGEEGYWRFREMRSYDRHSECGRVNLSEACSRISGSVVHPFEICAHEFKVRPVLSDHV